MKAIYDILKNKELFSFQLQYAETDFLFSSDSKSEVEFLKDFFQVVAVLTNLQALMFGRFIQCNLQYLRN